LYCRYPPGLLQGYPGFNLLTADFQRQSMAYLCSKGSAGPQLVPPGLHGVTNGHMEARWPKVGEPRASHMLGEILFGTLDVCLLAAGACVPHLSWACGAALHCR
jgi:hypothetical protein